MKKPYSVLSILIGFALMNIGLQCDKDDMGYKEEYSFLEKISLTPYKKTYFISDTIWLQFQTSDKSLFDRFTGSRISTDTTFLQTTINYNRRFPSDTINDFFGSVKVNGGMDMTFTSSNLNFNLLRFKTECTNNPYFFRVGFVPNKTGIYIISAGAFVNNCPNKLKFQYSALQFTFDLADCNKDVWLSIPPNSRGGETGVTDLRIDRKELFVFKVE